MPELPEDVETASCTAGMSMSLQKEVVAMAYLVQVPLVAPFQLQLQASGGVRPAMPQLPQLQSPLPTVQLQMQSCWSPALQCRVSVPSDDLLASSDQKFL